MCYCSPSWSGSDHDRQEKIVKTVRELGALVGERGWLQVGAFAFPVEVRDAKNAYGNARLLVEPVNGTGSEWVAVERVRFVGVGE